MRFDKRFEVYHKEGIGFSSEVKVLRDKATGVLYLFAISGYGGGLCPLLNPDGSPMIARSEAYEDEE